MGTRHFLSLFDLSAAELERLLDRAAELKKIRRAGQDYAPFQRKVLGMIFEKSSTRTRISFEAGMVQLGGSAIFLSTRDTQLGRGEPIEDTARIASSMVDIIMIRTFEHDRLVRFAEHSSVPVINALSDFGHPCQLLADVQAFTEHRGSIAGKNVAWIGDGNNMCNSYIEAAMQFGFFLRVACPRGYDPDPELAERAGNRLTMTRDPREAVDAAQWVTTDVWTSMGQEEENKKRMQDFAGFQVDESLMKGAASDAVFLHCLPAHRGEEVSAAVIDGAQSVVWDQAENRLHAQKALVEFLLRQGA